MKIPLAVSYGAGANSTALLVEFSRRGIRPDAVLFADTGAELPETYSALDRVCAWAAAIGWPEFQIVRATGKTLEQDCLDRKALPSIAYGFKTCSQRWKIEPQRRRLRALGWEQWRQAVGYDAGEPWRCKRSDDERIENWFPLVEWGIDREGCEEICRRAGLPYRKSACFFCPSSKPSEVVELSETHPELFRRALAIESNAEIHSLAGLGRRWNWANLVASENAQMRLFSGEPETPCGCHD